MTQSSAMGDNGEHDAEPVAARAPAFEPRPSRRLFATAASEPRARRLTDLLLLISSIVGLLVVTAAEFPSPGFLVSLTTFVRSAPSFLDTAWQISADALALFAIVLLVATCVRRRLDVARDLVVALAIATIGWLLVGRWAQGDWPAFTRALRSAQAQLWYPSPRLALPAAVIVTIAPHLTRPIRRVGRWLLTLACLGIVALGASSPLGAVAGVLVGATAGFIVHLIFGSSAGRPSLGDVERALSKVGVQARSLAPADRQRAGVFEVMGEDTNGVPLMVKVYGRDAHDSALATTLWRTLWYRDPGSPLRIGRLQQVEHEAFITLLAAQFGVLTEQVVTAGATVDDDAILVLRGRGTPLAVSGPPDGLDHHLVVQQLWKALATLHGGGIAHGQIDSESIILDGGHVGFADFGGASVGATDGRIGADRAQALMASVLLVGTEPAIAMACEALGADGIIAMLPYLQSATLTRAQRREVKEADLEIDDVRALAAAAAGVEEPELQQLRRITAGTILRVALPALAVVALTSAISGMELDGVWDEVIAASWWLLLLGFVLAQMVRDRKSVV